MEELWRIHSDSLRGGLALQSAAQEQVRGFIVS